MLEGRSQLQRRSHFAVRVVGLVLFLLPAPLVVLGVDRHVVTIATANALIEPLLVLAAGAIMLAGPVLFRDLAYSSGSSDEDGGEGPGPSSPPLMPGPTGGGIPLPDANQASERVRDHNRPARRRARLREPEREPRRLPAPRLPDHG